MTEDIPKVEVHCTHCGSKIQVPEDKEIYFEKGNDGMCESCHQKYVENFS